MRKLLLATVAGLSVSMSLAGYASAQSADVNDDTSGQSFPTPGQVTVRLNGRVRAYADYLPNTKQVQTIVPATTGAGANGGNTVTVGATTVAVPNNPNTSTGGQSSGAGTNKVASYGFQTYARLYPGFDGVAANGLKYGAALEIRLGSIGSNSTTTGLSTNAAGGGLAGSPGTAAVGRSTLYLRRAFGYFGTPTAGTVRFGETDGPTSLYETGTFENYADGNWNGDVYSELPTAQQLVWPFSVVSAEYSTNKIVYLSPQFYGFDAGVSFEPNTGGANSGQTGCGTNASIGCDQLLSTPTYESQRRRNMGEMLVRYRGTFGPVGLAATAAYITSGKVGDDGTPKRPVQFQGLDMGDGGLTVTYAGLTVGGHVLAGNGNNNGPFTLAKRNGKPEIAWIAGASYTIGPVIVGGSWVDVTSNGSNGNLTTGVDPTGQRREQGVSVGGTYSVAPGFAVFAVYDWAQRKEGAYDFVTGTVGATTNNKITGQVFGLGTSFAW